MNEKIERLIEDRINEATRKQINVKCNCIARSLGKPIAARSMFTNYLPDVWALPTEDDMIYDPSRIREAEEWENSGEDLGWAFDGLRFGINLCIHAMTYEKRVVELKTTFNGYLVYAEIEGQIKAYAPFPAWENHVNMFYEGALAQEKTRLDKEKQLKLAEKKRRFANFWESFRLLWGY